MQEVQRKTFAILKVLANSSEPLGSIVIARRLEDLGVDLGERAVRYHLKLMDEQGLTRLAGRRDGRVITELGMTELKHALVKDKVGFAISRIELLAFRTTFDLEKRAGLIPVNVSFFKQRDFQKALRIMKPVFAKRLCVSNLVLAAGAGSKMGDLVIPDGTIALATVCSIVVNGTLLKAGIPMNSKFGGLLQMHDHKPLRFIELIHYDGCSLDPSEIFIKARMTSVLQVAGNGSGNILANFREIPSVCRPVAHEVITKMAKARLNGVLQVGNVSEPLCEVPLELNRVGMILIGGLNPIAAVEESGIHVETHAMSTVVDYKNLVEFEEICE
ncbi:MAG: NrpR regulatory domain-containing protein [Dehalococcoidia bacterium]|nr:NrpR regulatory domain-containing protein [Dehalococcoidia bacterium]MDD5495386.1 NrpR regulatory domain-containing protein [Dehalococcoidia bacterium]